MFVVVVCLNVCVCGCAENRGQRKVFVPNKLLECLPSSSSLPSERLRWNTNEEIASYLISLDRHEEWLSCSLKTRPKNGSIILYNRKKVKYRKDGYCWKKRKDGKTTREDHMKLKVQGMECLYGCYVHSSIVPTFHRRCYWLLQNPDIVLVHYLNVPSLEDSGKCSPLLCAVSDRHDSVRWSRDDLLSQLKPMFHSMKCSVGSGDFSIEELVQHILDRQRTKPQPRTHTCLCNTIQGGGGGASGEEAGPTRSLSLTRSGQLLLSPALPPPPTAAPASPPSSSPAPPALPPPPPQPPGVATLSLTLLPSPVIGGLLLTPPSSSSLRSPPPPAAAPSPPSPPSSPSPPHPSLPLAFDPDSFLNSPKQGQTYGGPPSSPSPALCTFSPLSPPSLALSLSPTSTPPSSVSPPSSLSSLSSSEVDRRDSAPSSSPPSSSLPPPLSLSLSPTSSVAPPLLPLCLELGGLGESEGGRGESGGEGEVMERRGDDDDDDEGRAPPTKLALIKTVFFLNLHLCVTLQGGVKVLITGPWSEPAGRYSCVFDQSIVPASLIQPGVLRCYCPAHEAGLVCLQVLESGGSVSSSVLFEYRARNASSLPSSQLDWLSLDDNQFRMSILERLEQMERRMAEMSLPGVLRCYLCVFQSSQWFERRIVGVCERMMKGGRWTGGGGGGGGERLHHSIRHRGMTLLHLAAAQGYTHLIHTLIQWRSVNSDSLDLEQEVDPLNVDHFSCTPLMWACALGHQRAAELLYSWNSLALGIPDSLGRLPLAVARSRGHTRLAAALEELHTQRTHVTPRDSNTPPTDTHTPDTPHSSSSLPSPSDPSSPSPSSAYSSAPAPMDTSPSSPSSPSSSSSLPISHPSPSSLSAVSMWGEEPSATFSAGNPGNSAAHWSEVDMATLAEQIIEATPERIKQEDFPRGAESPLRERRDNPAIQDTWLATYLETVDAHTHSPPSALALQRLRPPSSAAWAEFLNASANGKMERDFALLTLTDGEQRELYEAARIIQNAFRRYKGRRLKEQQDMAAAVIQRCYRKYKQLTWIALKYALYKKMTQAAILIQSKFRSYYEQKRFQQSRRAAVLIQQYYRSYKEPNLLTELFLNRGSFLTKKQDQAARKIMRFLRRCRHRIKELKQSRELERRGLTT
uniref:CG-1 domain-containing protein n=1 Tax=Amphiprion ocellaris TaxID=80972 RepID=A0AAQ5ZUZ2_AMPOC